MFLEERQRINLAGHTLQSSVSTRHDSQWTSGFFSEVDLAHGFMMREVMWVLMLHQVEEPQSHVGYWHKVVKSLFLNQQQRHFIAEALVIRLLLHVICITLFRNQSCRLKNDKKPNRSERTAQCRTVDSVF